MPYPDASFRLLCLYRYWNMIQYFFPNKHLTDKDWSKVLEDYIPRFLNAKNELEYEIATLQLIGSIQDTHANLWGGNNKIEDWKGSYYAPFHTRFIENCLVVSDYYNPELKEENSPEIGTIITSIDGKDIQNLLKEKLPYYPASNYASQLRDIGRDMRRSPNERMKITYLKNGIEQTEDIKLYPKEKINLYGWYPPLANDLSSFKMLEENIGYITLQNIKKEDIDVIKTTFINTKAIIVDIRNYPSTFVPFLLGSFFVDEFTPFVKFTRANLDYPGEFAWDQRPHKIPPNGKHYKSKIVVLVNNLSQSQAEYTAMAFRAAPKTTIIGSTTAGADGNVSEIWLPGGLYTMISGIGVYYPDGTETQRVGIIPDIEVKPTIKGIKEGRDEVLEKAIEIINKE